MFFDLYKNNKNNLKQRNLSLKESVLTFTNTYLLNRNRYRNLISTKSTKNRISI